uniref:Uncharacterized protein n=1 Tax=Arundo donax TaxID=35708 RepID=A0A0A9FP50_ARUDO
MCKLRSSFFRMCKLVLETEFYMCGLPLHQGTASKN